MWNREVTYLWFASVYRASESAKDFDPDRGRGPMTMTADRQDFYNIGPPMTVEAWVAAQLDQAPPITPEQVATLSNLLAAARSSLDLHPGARAEP